MHKQYGTTQCPYCFANNASTFCCSNCNRLIPGYIEATAIGIKNRLLTMFIGKRVK